MDIRKWDAATWIAAAGAAIALVAALAAWWQAWLARRAAGAADLQAAAAQVQADAAQREAAAAEGQVIIMRQQLADAMDDKHAAAAPGFTFPASTIESTGKGKPPLAYIGVKQVGGPGLSEVTVTVTCDDNVRGFIAEDGSIVGTIRWTNSAPDSEHELKVSLAKADPVNVVLSFKSVAAGNGEPWTYTRTARPTKRISFV